MSFARPWWLAALLLLLPLVLLHLRRPALAVREVASLLIWERMAASAESPERRLRPPRHPLLLALQALAICALALALAGPQRMGGTAPPSTVYVVDGSLWMHVGTRLADARGVVLRDTAAQPGRRVAVVTASAPPAVVYRGDGGDLGAAVAGLGAGRGAGDLAAGMALGARLLGNADGRMVVLRAPENPLPSVAAARGRLTSRVIGGPTADQGLFARGARCGIGPAGACEVVAAVRNEGANSRIDRYAAYVDGTRALELGVAVAAHSTSTIVLTARPGSSVRLQLTQPDALGLDDAAWFAVPTAAGLPAPMTVTLVGDPTTAKPLAQALAAAPGVTLQLRTPASYRRRDALASDLVVLDGFLPASGLPPSPAVFLVAPPRLPGGNVGSAIAAPVVSGTAAASELLGGVDLASLSIDGNAATRLSLPSWLSPVVWSPAGALLAAGDNGRQRVAVLAFDPARSNLAQLAAFPILARNVESWAGGWAAIGADDSLAVAAVPGARRVTVARLPGAARSVVPTGLPAGLTGLAPGQYAVEAQGADINHSRSLTAALAAPAAATGGGPVDLVSWVGPAAPSAPHSLAPFLIALAAIAMAAEWLVWRRLRR